jgi:hypothetical protein
VLPVIVFVAVLVPLLLLAFVAIRRRTSSVERMTTEEQPGAASLQDDYEQEFAAAEAYEAGWREEQHNVHPDDNLA